jgi:hypothetical protein
LDELDERKTVELNKGQGIFHRCWLKGKEKKLFEYLEVGIKVLMQGFHKKVYIDIL